MFALGCPLYNSERYLPRYLESISSLDYPKSEIHLRFIITKSKDKTEELVRDFVKARGHEYGSVEIRTRDTIQGENYIHTKILNVAEAWKTLADMSKPLDLMVIEHDNTVPPDSVKRCLKMVSMGADMCSGLTVMVGGNCSYKLDDGSVFRVAGMPTFSAYTVVSREKPVLDKTGRAYSGIEMDRQNRPAVIHIGRATPSFHVIYLPKSFAHRVIKVGAIATGMAYITRRLMDDIPFECLPDSSQDLVFCQRAFLKGYRLLVDTDLWYEHHHFSYYTWVDNEGRRVVYYRGQNLDNLYESEMTTCLESLTGMIIPKEEVERQDLPPGRVVARAVDWELGKD